MVFLRKVPVELVDYNLQTILQFIERYGTKKPKLLQEQSIRAVAGIQNPTFITIADTTVTIERVLPEIPDILEEFDCNIDLRVNGSQIVVRSLRDMGTPMTLFQFTVGEDFGIIKKEIKLISTKILSSSSFLKFDICPVLKLSLKDGKLVALIRYKFGFVESIFLNLPPKVYLHVYSLISEYLEDDSGSEAEFTPKAFYDSITKKTSEYPLPSTIPVIKGLEAELLPFQGSTVTWLLNQEGMEYDSNTKMAQPLDLSKIDIQSRLDQISYGFKLIHLPFYEEDVWFNKYSGNMCSNSTAIPFLETLTISNGKGLLSEEMGLGKTVEILALILSNQRPNGLEEFYQDEENGRLIRRSKATLIICPESLLSQWIDEIDLHAPGLKTMIYKGIGYYKKKTSEEVAQLLSNCDVIVTSYNILQREIHNAVYDPSKSKRLRKSTIESKNIKIKFNMDYFKQTDINKVDVLYKEQEFPTDSDIDYTVERYSSPLVLVEFWRLVLDEVQMVGTTSSNIYKISTLIPRVHSWGVSGTPIKHNIDDLASLVSFLKMHPFGSSQTWKNIKTNSDDIVKLFTTFCFRHTKEMVKDDIHLPPQQKILLRTPFGPVEQDNYKNMFLSFLRDVKLDNHGNPTVNDWNDDSQYLEKMRKWLIKLRRICCHANLIQERDALQRSYASLGRTSGGYDTIETVLQTMISDTREKIMDNEKAISTHQIEKGQYYEMERQYNVALNIWTNEAPILEERIEKLRELVSSTPSDKHFAALRSNLELLHRAYYFIASSHFRLTAPPIEQLVPGITQQILEQLKDSPDYEMYLVRPDKIDYSDVVVHRALTEEEMKHRMLEDEYYAKAQIIRHELLSAPMNNVTEYLVKVRPIFRLPIINIMNHPIFANRSVSFGLSSLQSAQFAFRVKNVTNQVNMVSALLNRWISELVRILSTPLFDSHGEMPSTDDYVGSIDEQSKSAVYLDCIQQLMSKRNVLLNGGQLIDMTRSTRKKARTPYDEFDQTGGHDDFYDTSMQSELRESLEKEIPQLNFTHPLRDLFESRNMLSNEVLDHGILADLILNLKDVFDEQTQARDNINKYYKLLSDLYNKKIIYFKQLQSISDHLVFPPESQYLSGYLADIRRLENSVHKASQEITNSNSRIRYLVSLSSTMDMDKECIICRSEITVGSLVKCGHRYCKICLTAWLGTSGVKKDCPMCNETINPREIYDFTLNKEILTADMMIDEAETEPVEQNEIFEVYHKIDENVLNSINSITIPYDYGSKINTILRQVIWLQSSEPDVQIVIYSQWTKMLQIIAKALKHCNIKYLGSQNFDSKSTAPSRSTLRTSISQFKKDSSITCFLLNAKVDASGLNLINATHVFICEPLVQTALELQAISRVHRIGQKKPTTVWMFSITRSVEEGVMLLTTRRKLKEKEQLDTEELSKCSGRLVKAGGEIVENDDLWGAFFSNKV